MAHLSAHICQLTSLRDAHCMIFGPQLHCTAGRAQRPARWLAAHRQHVPQHFSAAGGKRRQHAPQCCHAAGSDGGNGSGELIQLDANQLQTMLQIAVDSEDFARAGALRDELNARQGGGASWAQLGVLDWLVDRAEQLGLRFPTGVYAGAAWATDRSWTRSSKWQAATWDDNQWRPCLSPAAGTVDMNLPLSASITNLN